jgi:hypothetical protein
MPSKPFPYNLLFVDWELDMCEFLSWCMLQPVEQAAWVQAIGSVLAILVAVAIPAISVWSRIRGERRLREERTLNAILQIYDPINSLRVSLDEFYETSGPEYDHENPGVSIDPNEGNFQVLVPAMIASVSSLNDMGDLAPAMRKFLFMLIELDRYLKMIPAIQRTGSPGFWLNNIDDIRDMLKAVITEADVVLEEIKATMTAANSS